MVSKMLQLLLSKPLWHTGGSGSPDPREPLFNELEEKLWSLVTLDGRSEPRLWLCDAISSIRLVSRQQQCDLFMKLMNSNRGLAAQVLQMIFEKMPGKLGMILARRSHMLKKFFRDHPKRILQWFSNFSFASDAEHGKGAKALSQFAFINRDICWEELEWKGQHGQSPAVVATKPHYFLDLDVLRTIENFLEYVPEFWSSDQFSESIEDGEIFSLDAKYFVDLFIKLMYNEHLTEVWDIVSEFLMLESFPRLCRRLLIILDERELSILLEMIQHFLSIRARPDIGSSSYWLEVLLSECRGRLSMDQVLLLNGLFNKRRQILRLLQTDEAEADKLVIKDIATQIYNLTVGAESLLPSSEGSSKKTEMLKRFSLLSWVLLYKMSDECCTLEAWEKLFLANGIDFRRSDLRSGVSENSSSDGDDRTAARNRKKKRKKKARKKRKRETEYEIFDDDLLDIDDSSLQPISGSWYLSVDGYSASWSTADLPEYLSNHCLSLWLKQV